MVEADTLHCDPLHIDKSNKQFQNVAFKTRIKKNVSAYRAAGAGVLSQLMADGISNSLPVS
jgi:hypothetical protein